MISKFYKSGRSIILMLKLRYIVLLFMFFDSALFSQSVNHYIYYQIRVELDAAKKTIEGTEIIFWRNTGTDDVKELRIHLYHNGYRNSFSSFAREGNLNIKKYEIGYTDISFIKVVDNFNTVTKTNFIQPDDNNLSDGTVLQVHLSKPIRPNEGIKLNIGFITKLPAGGIGRSCYARGKNFFLVSEWYPKLGVYEEGKGWNCHQYHYGTDFHSDFGFYDVGITLPKEYKIGASSEPVSTVINYNGSKTIFYKESKLKDFAWCASDDFYEINDEFRTIKLPGVKLRLLLQNNDIEKINRLVFALKNGLKYYGDWISEFPFKTVTVIELPRTCKDYCTSYPGLFTIKLDIMQAKDEYLPEEKIFHSLGHQYFSSTMGINNTEEPWLDEGIVAYLTGKILQKCYGSGKGVIRIADGLPIYGIPMITLRDFPIVSYTRNAFKPYFISLKSKYLGSPFLDPISKFGWKYQNQTSYKVGSACKPALMLETMSNYFGSTLVFHSLKTFYLRYRYEHSETNDWINNVEGLFGKKLSWFFNQVLFETEVVDNSVVSIRNREFKDHKYFVEIIFSRKGAVKIPVDLKINLENGAEINDSWDCNERWIKKTYICDAPAVSAIIDPYNKITLDVNTFNNNLTIQGDYKPVLKWAAQWLFWMQTLLQSLCAIC